MSLRNLLGKHGISQAELARGLGVDRSTISLKLSGLRGWRQDEINRVLDFLEARLGRRVPYEKVFRNGKAA